ncbi:hypothetical protein NM688_g7908 [Phlebia brevispora]|uniref:Uncharacterized protein n=1 Tax=Phlebia brevispora TaxID=194682 RepID=A0ACC1S011_9APHY|nr:hypothetical protein NM688_g7908 [Phlebia brevispora]
MSIKPSENPPFAPTDRLGTSMRILLHDTQATLEKFSERLETLTNGVDKTHQNINVVQKLFEREHESFIEENVALVNRCQLEIQKSLGKPAQAQEIKDLQERLASVDRRLEALDNRFDILHLLNQTQSQTLQALQDQQTQLISSLAPVLPLLQAIPLHVNTAKLEKFFARKNDRVVFSDISSVCERIVWDLGAVLAGSSISQRFGRVAQKEKD